MDLSKDSSIGDYPFVNSVIILYEKMNVEVNPDMNAEMNNEYRNEWKIGYGR